MNSGNVLLTLQPMRKLAFVLASFCFVVSPIACPVAFSQAQPTVHAAFDQIGNSVPSFGGMYVDEDRDTIYIYIVPGLQGTLDDANTAISNVFGSMRPPEHNVVGLQGQYPFVQLESWYDLMQPQVLPMSGVLMTGIDDANNQLHVGVASSDAAQAVKAELDTLGIPRAAVEIDLVTAATSDGSLTDRIRPLYGGLQIESNTAAEECTLGAVARDVNGNYGFITASHCSNTPFRIANPATVFSQNVNTAPDATIVADETINPVLTANLTCTQGRIQHTCPQGSVCRCTDTLFAKVRNNNLAQNTLGLVTRPDVGRITWNGGNNPPPTFTVTNKSAMFAVGQSITIIGMVSGRQTGTITELCDDWKFNDFNRPRYILCLNVATYRHGPGDSGAPIVIIPNPNSNSVTFTGTHVGDVYYVRPVRHFAVYSPIDQTQTELGNLTVCSGGGC